VRGASSCLRTASAATHRNKEYDQPMTDEYLARLYICAIFVIGACLFLAVDKLEPNRRLAMVLKCVILVAGGAAIVKQLT
jgi:hypothetical protein